MKLILTHEQADFDALASLLAGYLLDDEALPVLPRRLNRNARAFLSLYGAELPFVDTRDLPSEAIGDILLVDTQSLVSLKGMTQNTRVQVIDHHQPRPDLPSAWQASCQHSGACTTLLVESLQENSLQLSMLQATLLLLGIYEDTGSLTYTSTTPRDGRAVAYLLEQGANLHLLSEYLNPPLSPEQRRVYDLLLNTAETLSIHGQKVILARAMVGAMEDEISSVAHKLRDLLDPDALFLLVGTGEGIRLVARSTTDRINVAVVARLFGGGGHERAASALIHYQDGAPPESEAEVFEQVYQRLVAVLPQHIQPAITVGQIMSRRPHLLSPQTSLEEAAALMQRYGYEGYPVIKNGQVVGLLTRRAVDKATTHRLSTTAGSLMEGGQYSVTPDDPLDHLQQVMAASGWGQIPVIDPASGEVIGIVTRTDLLRTLSPTSGLPGGQNMTARLETALPPARLALLKMVAGQAHDQHVAVYIVGGFVRDLLLERPGMDFDVVVEGDAGALARSLAAQFGGRTVSHSRFSTAKWHIAEARQVIASRLGLDAASGAVDLPESLDLISARSEFYAHPTALPTVERSSIKQDLHRRDFTINTLALRLDGRHFGELHDYWGGLTDLRQGVVRVLHSLSFIDDPTRLLRAVRFEQRFGFTIEPRTLDLMKEALSLLTEVSGERLHHELDLIFSEKLAAAMMSRLHDLGILSAIDPDLPWEEEIGRRFPLPRPDEIDPHWGLPARIGGVTLPHALAYLVWLFHLSDKSLARVGQRLKLPGYLCNLIHKASALWQSLPQMTTMPASQVVRILDEIPLVSIYAVNLVAATDERRIPLLNYAATWRHIHPYTSGNALLAHGLLPSPAFGAILSALRTAWLDGAVQSRREEEALLVDLLRQWDLPTGSAA